MFLSQVFGFKSYFQIFYFLNKKKIKPFIRIIILFRKFWILLESCAVCILSSLLPNTEDSHPPFCPEQHKENKNNTAKARVGPHFARTQVPFPNTKIALAKMSPVIRQKASTFPFCTFKKYLLSAYFNYRVRALIQNNTLAKYKTVRPRQR